MISPRKFSTIPIIGQEAICSYGLGRVTGFSETFPHDYVEVCPYAGPRPYPMKFDPVNVVLVMPGTGELRRPFDEVE